MAKKTNKGIVIVLFVLITGFVVLNYWIETKPFMTCPNQGGECSSACSNTEVPLDGEQYKCAEDYCCVPYPGGTPPVSTIFNMGACEAESDLRLGDLYDISVFDEPSCEQYVNTVCSENGEYYYVHYFVEPNCCVGRCDANPPDSDGDGTPDFEDIDPSDPDFSNWGDVTIEVYSTDGRTIGFATNWENSEFNVVPGNNYEMNSFDGVDIKCSSYVGNRLYMHYGQGGFSMARTLQDFVDEGCVVFEDGSFWVIVQAYELNGNYLYDSDFLFRGLRG